MPAYTFTSGSVLTASQCNSYMSNCAASAKRDSALAIGNATDVVVSWSSEEFDNDNMWVNTSTSRITVNTAGIYTVSFNISWASNATGERIAWIQKNGSGASRWGMVRGAASAAGETIMSSTTIMSLAVNDYIEVGVYQSSGGNLNIGGSGTSPSRFGASRVSAA